MDWAFVLLFIYSFLSFVSTSCLYFTIFNNFPFRPIHRDRIKASPVARSLFLVSSPLFTSLHLSSPLFTSLQPSSPLFNPLHFTSSITHTEQNNTARTRSWKKFSLLLLLP